MFKKYYSSVIATLIPWRSFKLLLLTGFGLIWALGIPALSAQTPPQNLAQEGQTLYEAGKLDRAIEVWQDAANAYATQGNSEGKIASLLNTATAQQGLGLYTQSCETIFQAYSLENPDCLDLLAQSQTWESQLQSNSITTTEFQAEINQAIAPILQQPVAANKAIALLRLGDFLREKAHLKVATTVLEASQATSQQLNDLDQETAVLISLGNTARAIALEQQNRFPPKTVALNIIANRSSSADAALEPYQPAIQYYQQAAEATPNSVNSLKAQLNHLSFLLDSWEFWQQATTELSNDLNELGISDQNFLSTIREGGSSLNFTIAQELQPQIMALTQGIRSQLDQPSPSRSQIYGRINFAQSLIRQGLTNQETAEILATAIQQARQLNNPVAEAEAIGYLGYLYEQQKQYSEARRLTETALELAPTAQYPEIAYRWQAQLGRILTKSESAESFHGGGGVSLTQQQERAKALSAYEAAFNTIKALRSDLATTNTPVEPIFRQYISLLLQAEPTPAQLNQAREVLESLQIAELDNFFRDPCSEVAEETVIIDKVDPQAAVIYPIVLSDRLEVILTVPGQPLQRYTTSITASEVANKIEQLRRQSLTNPGFAEAIRGARGDLEAQRTIQESLQQSIAQDILPLAQEIYDWLIRPAEPALNPEQVKTLVFVLDGALRNIPMALLHDGEQYLIEKDYNIALSSGLQLTAPQPLIRQPIRVLAAGVTQAFPEYNFPPIPQVEAELNKIKAIFADSEVLLNEKFTAENLRRKLAETDYPVIHLATHGQFSSTSDRTFILSGDTAESDRLINVNQLDNLLRVRQLGSAQPIELLVLSACDTAQGDSQAILGLAGVAVRAGARSTLATLWGANDAATAELMGYFYQNLASENQVSKAQALKDAQITLLQATDSQYSHPYYWAPFVLVGNWL
ncbi:MAG TPA: CHAT domain-containing protein [Xenococcaceae cyanobacterium]